MEFHRLDAFDRPGTTVLTVNQRLASWLRHRYERTRLERGDSVWESPDILPFNSWLLRCWAERFDSAAASTRNGQLRLLTPLQTELVWEQIIRGGESHQLLNPAATARSVASAWALANAWQIYLSSEADGFNPDVQAFIAWKDAFVARSRSEHWLDQARLPQHLAGLFADGMLTAPDRLLLAGFDRPTPQQQQLLDALQAVGTQVETLPDESIAADVRSVSFADARSELEQVARWARFRIERQPQQQIGIIVPDLQQRRDEVERVFRRVMYPAALFADQCPEARPFNVSLGKPLLDYPMIHVAITALRGLLGHVPWQDLSHLLRSAFLPAAREHSQRALLESALRERGQPILGLQQVLSEIRRKQQIDAGFCAHTAQALQAFLDARRDWSSRQSASDWARCLSGALSQLGWPGDRGLDSVEYQTSQAWLDALRDLSSLSGVTHAMAVDEALRLLSRSLRNTIFQPQSVPAPIQIMGVLESAGQQFDALWVTGMSQSAWPPPARPNPYLPLAAQRSAGIPESSAGGQYQMASQQTQIWAQSAATVWFSWPAQVEGQALAGSALLQSWPMAETGPEQAAPDDFETRLFESARLESMLDERGPELVAGTVAKGGVSIFRDQSACPFRAFARHRLAAEDLEEPESGLDARTRGSLVHRCLEMLWLRLKNRRALLQMAAIERDALVDEVVAQVLEQEAQFTPTLRGQFGDIERRRLTGLLLDWLQLDAGREDFEVLDAEKRHQIQIGGLGIHTTVDRVDRLADGSLAVVDYKTGECSHKDWFGQRPKDPQLPLYGCFAMDGVGSLAFGRLKKGKLAYEGVTAQSEHFSALRALGGLKIDEAQADWPAQQALWRQQLTRLAEDFMTGDARVDPLPDACRYCHLDPLCRIQDATEHDEDDATG